MMIKNSVYRGGSALLLAGALTLVGCAGGPLTTREKGAGIGALGGAAAGGLIGGAVGLGTGAVIGDQMQRREYRDYYDR